MAAWLDHLIVPATDRVAAARRIATLFDVPWAEQGPFGPFLNDRLTLDFDQWSGPIPTQHYAFHVGESEFDAILGRLRSAGIAYRSLPHGPHDGRVNESFGGRIVYWAEPDGHVWELLTVSYARRGFDPRAVAPA